MNALALPTLWAAVAVACAAIAVFVLYLLKPPPRRLLIASSLIWDRVLRESHRSSDWLRWLISVLLAVLITALIVIAITRPQLGDAVDGASRLMLVLDNSPTMAARTTDGATRWEHAVAKARAELQARGADTQVLLADTMRRIATPGYEGRDAALERLATLRVAHGVAPRIPVTADPAIEMLVFSDGVQLAGVPPHARIESVFDPVENAGITAFEVRPLPADPGRYQAFVEVTNASSADKRIELTIAGVGALRVTTTVPVAGRSSRAQTIDISTLEAGPVRASLTMPGDGLAADDTAFALLPMKRMVRVTLVTSGNPYLEKSLRAQPRVRLTVASPGRYADSRDVDAWVFDRFAPRNPPAAPALLFGPGAASWLPARGGEIVNASAASWAETHPLLENISLHDLYVDRVVPMRATEPVGTGDAVLVRARDRASLVMAHEGAARWISFAFSLEESNFGLHAGFPIFLNNALNWMVGEQAAFATGLGVVEVPLSGARVIAGDGTELPVQAVPGASLLELDEPGFLTAVTANRRLRIAANLLDVKVTDLNRSSLPVARPEAGAQTAALPALPFEPWAALLLLAALLLGFEWWSWNRRVTL
jgi:hypothetical protein